MVNFYFVFLFSFELVDVCFLLQQIRRNFSQLKDDITALAAGFLEERDAPFCLRIFCLAIQNQAQG
jgi:hypothetical protein